MDVAQERVRPVRERDVPRDRARELDLRHLVYSGPLEMEVVEVRAIGDLDLVRARIELGYTVALRVLEVGANRIAYARSSAPKRSASAETIRSRAAVASSSVSVRSGDWNARWIATDLRPVPTWSPR
jgi:hypothetical protein